MMNNFEDELGSNETKNTLGRGRAWRRKKTVFLKRARKRALVSGCQSKTLAGMPKPIGTASCMLNDGLSDWREEKEQDAFLELVRESEASQSSAQPLGMFVDTL